MVTLVLALLGCALGDLHGVHDPSRPVFSQLDQRWHVFSSHDGMRSARSRSRSLSSGFDRGEAVLSEVPAWAKAKVPGVGAGDFWAPDVLHSAVGNEWRLYWSVSGFGSQQSCVGLSVAVDAAGPWSDRGEVFCSSSGDGFNAIDPAPFVDSDKRHYMTFGSFWRGIYLLELDPFTGLQKGQPVGPLAANPADSANAIEASYLHKDGDYYYLFVNWGACCRGLDSTYRIFVGRSKRVSGPYLDAAGKDMAQGGGLIFIDTHWHDSATQIGSGHIGVIYSSGSYYITYHYYDQDAHGEPALGLRSMWFDENAWPVAGPTISTGAMAELV